MRLNFKTALATMAMLTAVSISISYRAASADQSSSDESQMNHEMMESNEGMQMPECSDNPDTEMNHEQMDSEEHQMSMQQCSDNPDAKMNHEQMMNSDGEMSMPDDAPTSNENE